MKAEWTNSDSLTTSQTTKAILVVDVPQEDIGKSASIMYLGHDKYLRSIEFIPIQPMPKKYIEREIKIETERDVEVCTHGITLGRNLLIEELEK